MTAQDLAAFGWALEHYVTEAIERCEQLSGPDRAARGWLHGSGADTYPPCVPSTRRQVSPMRRWFLRWARGLVGAGP